MLDFFFSLRSRSYDKDRDYDRDWEKPSRKESDKEREKERLKRGLPPLKSNHLAGMLFSLIEPSKSLCFYYK